MKRFNLFLLFLCYFLVVFAQDPQGLSDKITKRRFSPQRKLAVSQLPSSVDNSVTKFFPPIISQTGGSCAQASGIGYMLTYELNRLLNRDASASTANRMSYLFSWNMINGGEDQGGFVDEGLTLAKRFGMMSEADYGTSGTYQFKWATGYDKYYRAMHNRAKDILTFPDSIELMKRYLYDAGNGSEVGGILTFSGYSSGWTIDNYYEGPSATGYKSLLKSLPTDGAHAMTIAGYDDLVAYTDSKGIEHKGAFIVVNSWGSYYHDRGRFYLPYDFFRDPSISSLVLSDKVQGVEVYYHEPKVVFKVSVDSDSRDDLRFQVGGSTSLSATSSDKWSSIQAFYNQGGDYPMQGNYLSTSIELGMDFTLYMDSTKQYKQFFLNALKGNHGKKMGSAKITGLQIIDYRGPKPVYYNYEGTLPRALVIGENILAVSTDDVQQSASSYSYLDADGNADGKVFNIRCNDGKIVNASFINYDKDKQTITIKMDK